MDANQFTDRADCSGLRASGKGSLIVAAAIILTGCAAVSKVGDLASAPLEYVGLIKSSADDAKAAAQDAQNAKEAKERERIKSIKISLFAGPNLNANVTGQGLALVTRIYLLRDTVALSQAPYEAFLTPEAGASIFGSDVVSSREIVLTPGQQIEAPQDIGPDVNAIAVVALFRNPAPSRWRLVFNLKDAAREGIVIGANACALTVTSGLTGVDADGRSLQLLPSGCPS